MDATRTRMTEVISTQVLYDHHSGGPHPDNVRVLFVMRDKSHNGIEERLWAVIYDPRKPTMGAQQWIPQ